MRLFEFINEGIKVYHGAEVHGRRVIGHTGKNSTTFGSYDSKRYGWFFSSNPKYSALYGTVDSYEISIPKSQVIDVGTNDFLGMFHDWCERHHPNAARVLRQGIPVWNYFEDDMGEIFMEFVKEKKIKVVKFTEYIHDETGKELKGTTYVVFDLHIVRRNPDPAQPDLFLK